MTDIRTSKLGGGATPYGTSTQRDTLIPSPEIGQTYYNGTLGVQEIYTSSGWLPATGANDFNVTLNGTVTSATFTKEYFAGAYTINSSLLDNTYDIYVYDTAGNQVGYTKTPSLNATGNFNKIVIIGGSLGDLLSFSYKTTFTATNTTSQVAAGAFITSATPTALNSIDDTTTIVGGNFSSNVAVYFVGSDNVERAAKSIVRSSDSQLIVTRPDNFPTNLGTYKLVVENPGVTRPTGSSLHILNNAITAGTTPNWTTATTLPEVAKNIPYSTTLLATDTEGTDIDYSVVSGSLPAGITLNNETGVLSGTYTGADFNTTNLVIRAVDTGGNTVDRTFTIYSENPVWVTSSLPSHSIGASYSQQLLANDLSNNITYSLVSGSLPTGISLSSSGLISGSSTQSETANFTVRAADPAGNITDRSFSISSQLTVETLVIAGGGGGGGKTGGGGGAGGLRYTTFNALVGTTYTVTVGNGGAGGVGATATGRGANGQNSSVSGSNITTISATGGGGGGARDGGGTGNSGGSGGGSCEGQPGGAGNAGGYSPVEGYSGGNGGFDAPGYSGAGGGGAGGAANNATNAGPSNGGPGTNAYSVWASATASGSSGYYAGGGGGADHAGSSSSGGIGGGGNGGTSPQPGAANTGSGGGGFGSSGGGSGAAGAGGKGIVIMRIPSSVNFASNTNGTVYNNSGGYNYIKWNSSGTVTF